MVLVFRNVGDRPTATNYHPVSLLSVVIVGLLRSVIVQIMTRAPKLTQIFVKIKFKRSAKIFEVEMTSFWLTLRYAWTRHRPKI